MPSKLLTLIVTLVLPFAATGVVSAAPGADEILGTLKPGHPRLLLDAAKIDEVQVLVKKDAIAKRIYERVKDDADKALSQKPAFYELRDGRRLIYVSGEVLARVRDLAFVHLMTGERKYADRAWLELESASRFKDWNPNHFLDTAILTKAFAIGLDWLWDAWTPQQRQVLREAIVEKGLKPATDAYEGKYWWPKVTNNWNQVCNGGIGMGALAVADTDPELAGRIIHQALESIPLAMKAYAPDGASHEGLSYWSFGSLYNIMLIASLESALGNDFGLGKTEGFRQSGDYQIFLSGTNRMAFDFGDCSHAATSTAQHLWMGRRYGVPRYTGFRGDALSDGEGGSLWDLLWFDTPPPDFSRQSIPLDKHFKKVEVASMRDSWDDGKGFIVAMQGGSNGASHRHLDLGSFMLEVDGVRWIVDSGKEGQTYQQHRNKTDRNDFYRVRAEGHNTLVINPDAKPDQDPAATASFTDFVSRELQASASIDLTSAYKRNAGKVTRTFRLDRGKSLTITDIAGCGKPSEVWSFFHTRAEVTLSPDKRTAVLKQDGKSIRVRLGQPTGALFKLMPAEPFPNSPNPPSQTPNKGLHKLAVHLTAVKDVEIAVRFDRLESPPAEGKGGE